MIKGQRYMKSPTYEGVAQLKRGFGAVSKSSVQKAFVSLTVSKKLESQKEICHLEELLTLN